MQLTIKTKLLLVLASLTLMLAATATAGWIGLALTHEAFRTVYADRVLPLQQLKSVSDMYAVNLPTTAQKVRDGVLSWGEGIKSIDAANDEISQRWTAYLGTYLTPEEERLSGEARALMATADRSIARLRMVMVSQDRAGLAAYVAGELYPSIDPLTGKIEQLVDLQRRVAAAELGRADRIFAVSKWSEVLLLALALVAVAAGAWITVGGVMRPLSAMTEAMRRIAARDFATQVPSVGRPDEIGAMAAALEIFRQAELMAEHLQDENKEQRAWLERLLDELPVGVTIFDRQQRLVLRNSTMNRLHPHPDPKRLIGTSLDQLIRAVLASSVAPSANEESFVRDLIARYQNTREGRFETRFPGGAEVSVYFRWIDDKYLVLVHTDISALREAERRATQAEQRMRSIVESLPLGLVLYDESERRVLVNQWFETELPRAKHEADQLRRHEDIMRLVPPDEITTPDGRTAQGQAAVDLMMSTYRSQPRGVMAMRRGDRNFSVHFANLSGIGRVVMATNVTDLVRAQRATEAAERRMRSVVENLPLGVILYGEDERLSLVNQWVQGELPRPKVDGALSQEAVVRAVPPDEVIAADGTRAQGQAAADLMMSLYRREARGVMTVRHGDRHFVVNFANLPGIGRLLALTNITDLVQAQRTAEESERRLRTAIAEIPLSFSLFAPDHTLRLFNEGFRREFRTIAEIIRPGVSVREIVAAYLDASDRPTPSFTYEEWQRAKADPPNHQGFIDELARRFLHRLSEPVDVERDYGTYRLRQVKLPNGEIVRVSADITDLRQKEAEIRRLGESALAQRTATLQEIIDTIPQAVAVLDRAQEVRFVNRSLSELIGGGGGSDRPVQMAAILAALGVPQPSIDELFAGGPREIEVTSRAQRPLRIRVASIPAGDTLLTISDLSEQRRAEAERLEQQQRVLEAEKSQAVLTLAGTIAHDFNNLLAVILGFSSIASAASKKVLDASALPPADARELADVVASIDKVVISAERGRNVVASLNALSQERRARVERLDLRMVVKDVEQLLRVLVPSSIRLDLDLLGSPCVVAANATQIEQIVTNLCVNAVHALEGKAGEVGIGVDTIDVDGGRAEGLRTTEAAVHRGASHVEVADDGTVSVLVGVLTKGRYARLRVVDNGHGMTEEVARKVLTPFFTTKAPGVGTGLGLSSVIEIVASHQGAIHIRTKAGAGTTFMILLPVAGDVAARVETDAPAPSALPPDADIRTETRVLVVDDEALLAELAANVLRRAGYEVEAFTDPAAALGRLRSDPLAFDIVVTDQTMPGMTGLELVEQLRPLRPDLPIIICTGHVPEIEKNGGLPAGIRHVLRKPYSPVDLATMVRDALAEPLPAS
ncbi:MAG TPA: PAS-domain containing protein [Alphaproteobacteria bacterium]|nr:PAS-domain containing protein [Alphaproteobacteria bacterium]